MLYNIPPINIVKLGDGLPIPFFLVNITDGKNMFAVFFAHESSQFSSRDDHAGKIYTFLWPYDGCVPIVVAYPLVN